MLKEVKIKNYKSFKNETVLSLEAMGHKNEELDGFNVTNVGENSILKVAAIYGHNSYGKSNIFKGLNKMQNIILLCSNPYYDLSIDNFKLDTYSEKTPTLFEVSFFLNNLEYRYGFEVFENKIFKEWLYKKNKRESYIYLRENSKININTGKTYQVLNKYIDFTRDNELFLSSMVRNNIQNEIKDIFNYIINKITIFSADNFDSFLTSRYLFEETIKKESLLEAIKKTDLGLKNIEIIKDIEENEDISKFLKEKTFHSVYDENKKETGLKEFDFEKHESEGTKKFYNIICPILDVLNRGATLFIDELDSKFSHDITKSIIELFQNLAINKKNAQLIFNTHDFYLLKDGDLRKDQIYIVDKDKYGESTLCSIGDFKGIDKKSNLLAHYLAGNFGGIGKVELGD